MKQKTKIILLATVILILYYVQLKDNEPKKLRLLSIPKLENGDTARLLSGVVVLYKNGEEVTVKAENILFIEKYNNGLTLSFATQPDKYRKAKNVEKQAFDGLLFSESWQKTQDGVLLNSHYVACMDNKRMEVEMADGSRIRVGSAQIRALREWRKEPVPECPWSLQSGSGRFSKLYRSFKKEFG